MNPSNHRSDVEAVERPARHAAEARFTARSVITHVTSRLARRSGSRRPRRTAPPLPANAALRWHVVRQHVADVAPTRILELGTGQGAVGARLAEVADYVGVEPDEISRSTSQARLPAGARMVADLDELASAAPFDLVCAFEVLEHIEDDVAALRQWVEHVRPGGHLLVSVPAGPERFGPFDELVGHQRRYSRNDLVAAFGAAGLEAVDVAHYGYPLGLLLESARNLVGRRRLAAGAAPSDAASRTAASGRSLQPPAWLGSVIWSATAPFRIVQRRFPDQGPGLVGLARRPG